jgi:hypothetical protein
MDKAVTKQLFVGKILRTERDGAVRVEIRNKVYRGEEVEILRPKGPSRKDAILEMRDMDGVEIDFAQPGSWAEIFFEGCYSPNDLLRRPEAASRGGRF